MATNRPTLGLMKSGRWAVTINAKCVGFVDSAAEGQDLIIQLEREYAEARDAWAETAAQIPRYA